VRAWRGKPASSAKPWSGHQKATWAATARSRTSPGARPTAALPWPVKVPNAVIRGETSDLSKQWSLSLEWRYGCTTTACTRTEEFKGLVLNIKG
jgi:hypothetical protein